MNVLVTGGGGFLAKAIVKKLLERGDTVTSISRGKYPELEEIGVECVQGDIRQLSDLKSATKGKDAVFHVAALAGLWGKRDTFFSINFTGTQNVVAACKANDVPKLIYTSTPSVVFGMDDLDGKDETTPYPEKFYTYYAESKAAAEQHVLNAANDSLFTCSLRPHLIWGPEDTHIVPLLLGRAKSGQLTQVGDGQNVVDMTYVDNGAKAHIQAADALGKDSPVNGQAYFISDDNPVKLWDWINELCDAHGVPRIAKQISYKKAYRIGAVMEVIYTVLPFLGEPRITRFLASNFAKSHWFSMDKAKKDFGYAPDISNEEGLKRTVAYFKDRLDSI